MKHRPSNRYLALAAGWAIPVPPPGRVWGEDELREFRIEQARDCERLWAAQRDGLLERHPGIAPWMLARSNRQLWELDEALHAVRERLADQDND